MILITKKIIFTIIILQAGLLFLQLGLTFGRATDGDKLVQIQSEISLLKSQNEVLQDQIDQATTISQIYNFIQKTGMTPASLSRLSPIPVAVRPKI